MVWTRHLRRLAWAALLLQSSNAIAGDAAPARLEPIAGGFGYLSNVAWPGGASDQLFVLEQHRGVIWIVDQAGQPRRFLDLGDRLIPEPNYEEGLLGLAFPIDFPAVPEVYVSYINRAGELQLSRFDLAGDGQTADPASETPLLTARRAVRMHHCGHVLVSPVDGDLYLCVGDRQDNKKRPLLSPALSERQGKIVRIDLGPPGAPSVPLALASVEEPGGAWQTLGRAAVAREDARVRPVVEAHGLRNPWRFALDPETGTMFLPDVGRHHWEEINVQPPGAAARHHGWPLAEGNECVQDCAGADLSWPVHVYPHTGSRCAIVGGAVYRGRSAPAWHGVFVFGDHCSGEVWALRAERGTARIRRLARTGMMLSAIGHGPGGEIVLVDGPEGAVHRLVFPDGDAEEGWQDTRTLAAEAALAAQREGFGRVPENLQTVLNSRRWRWGTRASDLYHQVRALLE